MRETVEATVAFWKSQIPLKFKKTYTKNVVKIEYFDENSDRCTSTQKTDVLNSESRLILFSIISDFESELAHRHPDFVSDRVPFSKRYVAHIIDEDELFNRVLLKKILETFKEKRLNKPIYWNFSVILESHEDGETKSWILKDVIVSKTTDQLHQLRLSL